MKSSFKPINTTKMATVENLLAKLSEFHKQAKMMEAENSKPQENVLSMAKAGIEVFSEIIEDFNSLELNDKLLSLANHSIELGVVFMRLLKKNLKKEITPEIRDLLQKSGLLCGLVV